MTKLTKVRDTVIEILQNEPETRDNDVLLILLVLKKLGLPTDIETLAEITRSNLFESISRSRRKAQEDYPFLAPSENVSEARKRNEEKYREEYK